MKPIAKPNPNLSQEIHWVCMNIFCKCHKNGGIKPKYDTPRG